MTDLARRFDSVALRAGVAIHVRGDAVVTGDAPSLCRAVTNLVDNARASTSPLGGRAVTLTVSG